MLQFILVYSTSHFAYFGIGRAIFSLLTQIFFQNDSMHGLAKNSKNFLLEDLFFWGFGLLCHLWLTYLFYRIHISLDAAFILVLMILVLVSLHHQRIYLEKTSQFLLSTLRKGPSFEFVLFFLLTVIAGLGVVYYDESLKTIWVNNYGDFPFHLALITNFANGGAPLIDYPIFPGEPLSYYFFVDFWTACLLVEPDNWRLFSLVICAQWVTSWTLIYLVFSKLNRGFFVYLIMLGGGTYPVFFKQMEALIQGTYQSNLLSHNFIGMGYPWTVFISSIWVPQRAALLGAALALAPLFIAVQSFNRIKINSKNRRDDFALYRHGVLTFLPPLGVYLGLLTMVHFYFAAIIIATLAGYFFLRILAASGKPLQFRLLILFFISCVLTLLPSYFLLSSKAMVLSVVGPWMPWKLELYPSFLNPTVVGSIIMWLINAGALFALFLFTYRNSKLLSCLLLAGFILLNVLQLGVWEWDNYKGFIGIYLILICLWAFQFSGSKLELMLFIALCLPGLLETVLILSAEPPVPIFESSKLNQARLLRERTSDEIIISEPLHDTIVTLAGRKIYVGYPGWLLSHGVKYVERETINSYALKVSPCEMFRSDPNFPHYIFFLEYQKIPEELLFKEDPVVSGLYDLRTACAN